MALDLYYFISTLPSLKATGEGAPKMSEFLARCHEALTEQECAMLTELSLCPPASPSADALGNAVVREWYGWQTAMRNAIVAFRARILKTDARKFLREEELNSYTGDLKRLGTVLEEKSTWKRQQGWEALQWAKLGELQPLNRFCFDTLVLYALKLQLLETHRRYSAESGKAVFEEIIKARLAEAAAHRVQTEG